MEDINVVIGLRDDEETWVTTISVSEQDALRIRNLRPSTRSGPQIDLPSVDGYARLEGDTLKLIYTSKGSQRTISVPFTHAQAVIDRAIEMEVARVTAERRSALGWKRIWEWASAHSSEARSFRPEPGEPAEVLLLKNEAEHIGVALQDGSIAIVSVANADAIPPTGSSVKLELDETGDVVISIR
ncbi:hypothetical protein L0Z31_11325 (plasmid) [Burkholderia vietnamiensis]|uniref:hypothetical protein n=1 Tax=Burkholderia vietnamiensis TaxID=60552 RepID=UPI00201876F3|nr:hypothetical protein [Burkholderia vietnamiensis]MCO1348065.1 hypothetical protein [Burkholderia vietnamiensis]MCO1430538.1 hypothetical protein [Burkholderia vietnamiensis]UQN46423.1 hypothetical protein L0Y95_13600 [Burkholderia vietnamiensis]